MDNIQTTFLLKCNILHSVIDGKCVYILSSNSNLSAVFTSVILLTSINVSMFSKTGNLSKSPKNIVTHLKDHYYVYKKRQIVHYMIKLILNYK